MKQMILLNNFSSGSRTYTSYFIF